MSTPTYADVCDAAKRMFGIAHRTPVMISSTANEICGAEIFFKCENFQRSGAFKFRGAYNAIAQLSREQRAAGVIAYSSGNHARAIAMAAGLFDIPATVVMPQDAPASKIAATWTLGAKVIHYDRHTQDRDELVGRLVEETGATLIPPSDHPDIIAGQGTVVEELLDETGPLDTLVACLGGGGLLAGCALVAKALYPRCSVIGVEPDAGNDGQQSLLAGRIVRIAPPDTVADGARATQLSQCAFAIIRQHVDKIVTVSDMQLLQTMRFFAHYMKIVVEPTGCLAAAAALHNVVSVKGKRVGVIISGGNVDLDKFVHWIQGREQGETALEKSP